MFCPSCGSQLKENARFCVVCGKRVDDITAMSEKKPEYVPTPAPTPAPAPVYVPAPEPVYTYKGPRYTSVSVVEEVKNQCHSPLMIVLLVSFTMMVFMNFLGILAAGNDLSIFFYDSMNNMLGDILYDVFDFSLDSNAAGFAAFALQLPSIVVCIGLWVVFFTSFDTRINMMSTAGFTIVKVVRTIFTVISVFCFGVYALFGFLGCLASLRDGNLLMIFPIVLVGAVFFAVAAYFVKLGDTIDCFSYAAGSDYPADSVSKYVIVASFGIAGMLLMSVFMSGTVFPVLSGICGAVAFVMIGIVIIRYRRAMEFYRYSPDSPWRIKNFSEIDE